MFSTIVQKVNISVFIKLQKSKTYISYIRYKIQRGDRLIRLLFLNLFYRHYVRQTESDASRSSNKTTSFKIN